MAEQLKPTVNRFLFVTKEDLRLMPGWPLEFRALFDPAADRELAQRIEAEREAWRNRPREPEEEIPF
jgi:hypothetical protein